MNLRDEIANLLPVPDTQARELLVDQLCTLISSGLKAEAERIRTQNAPSLAAIGEACGSAWIQNEARCRVLAAVFVHSYASCLDMRLVPVRVGQISWRKGHCLSCGAAVDHYGNFCGDNCMVYFAGTIAAEVQNADVIHVENRTPVDDLDSLDT